MTPNIDVQPDIKVSLKQTFGIDSEMEVNAFSKKNEYVPEIDKNYKFDRDTTLAIISGSELIFGINFSSISIFKLSVS